MSRTRKTRLATKVPTVIKIKDALSPNRAQAEGFVQSCFAHAYDATISEFMPTLMGLRNDNGTLQAVLGLRNATDNPLYLENYLSRPVEQELAATLGQDAISRSQLIEVGNFAVGSAGGGRWLITALTAYLSGTGHQWAVFTCGPELQNAFKRLGVNLIDMGTADPKQLPKSDVNQWGRYYDKKPRVMAANVAQSYQAINHFNQQQEALQLMWNAAMHAGQQAA